MGNTCTKHLPAQLKDRVAIQSVAQTTDGQGGFTEVWTTIANVWALIEPATGYEKMQAMQQSSPISHKVTIRYFPGLTTKHRLLFGSDPFAIKEVININNSSHFHKLKCVE
jgi:SPP1 family predicted phage head-tail adaptor